MMSESQIIQHLKDRNPLPALCPKEGWDAEITKEINDLKEQESRSQLANQAVKSGLLLWNDELDLSHNISQRMSNQLGSYWHGIMHRREGDFGNAKHWFRQAGNQSIYPYLYEQASEFSKDVKSWGKWDPSRFIDAVDHVVTNGLESTTEAETLRRIQVLEISLLVDYSAKA
ncbi:hypothetical protein [Aquibacillus saliphilus]|uniref:hypothetical protein n=1 Tax=Aquibacillus saliphilus TaxID=1909422 RepID=UPI001CF0784F|nr:hypothetical protein [Aquibacillus saliphilus]